MCNTSEILEWSTNSCITPGSININQYDALTKSERTDTVTLPTAFIRFMSADKDVGFASPRFPLLAQ